MLIKHARTGNEMDLDVTIEQIERYKARKEYVQDIFPDLTPTEREFLITGMSAEEQDAVYALFD